MSRLDEIEEAARATEKAPDIHWRRSHLVSRQISVQSDIQVISKSRGDLRVVDNTEIHSSVGATGVLAKNRRVQVPSVVAIARQGRPLETGAQSCGGQHRAAVEIRSADENVRAHI